MESRELATIRWPRGLRVSNTPLSENLAGSLAAGSRNLLVLGDGYKRPWRGTTPQAANTGGRQMFQVGASRGELKDIGATRGGGSLLQTVGRALYAIGAGQVSLEGVDVVGPALPFTASSALRMAVSVNGSYADALSGYYTVGYNAPSAPSVGVIESLPGRQINSLSFKIARYSTLNGGRSVASPTSAVISPAGKKIRLTFPLADTGQNYWAIFVTYSGFGGVGLHYRLAYNGSFDVPESAVAAGTVDGVARSLEIDFVDADLRGETAWIQDYPPPAGTHAVVVEACMAVLGCYADASAGPTSANPGTAIAISLPNFFGSYDPEHLLFLPEAVVAVLSRQTDNYAYIACRNSIHALQFVGPREDAPACTITTIWPDVGIEYAGNWTQVQGLLYACIGKGALVRMGRDGQRDYEWAAPVREIIKDWLPADTVLSWNPATLCVVVMNGNQALHYSLQNGEWSASCYLADAGVTGSVVAAVNTRGAMYISVTDGAGMRQHLWDEGATAMGVTQVSEWMGGASSGVNIYEVNGSIEVDNLAPVLLSVHRNLRDISARDAGVSAGSPALTKTTPAFTADMKFSRVAVFGTNIGGAGVNWLYGKITQVVNATTVTVDWRNPATGAAQLPALTVSGLYLLMAAEMRAIQPTRTGWVNFPPQFINARECREFALSLALVTNAQKGQAGTVRLAGTPVAGVRALTE